MKANDLKKAIKSKFSSLRTWKPFVETVYCFDPEYDIMSLEYVKKLTDTAWKIIGELPYIPMRRDCDDFTRKMAVMVSELHIANGGKNPLAYSETVGMITDGMHAFNTSKTDDGIYIFDYGKIQPVENYNPIWMRF